MSELNVKGIILPEISRSANGSYVIENGQFVVDADTGNLYLGNGKTTFSNLTYYAKKSDIATKLSELDNDIYSVITTDDIDEMCKDILGV